MSDIRLIHKNEKGMVLPLGLMFLAIIAILGTTAVIVTTTDLKIGSNYRASVQAFYDADAGVQYAIAKIEEGLKADPQTFTLPTTYAAPTDSSFNFTITFQSPGVTLTGSNAYTFTSTGSGPGNSQAVIKVSFKRDSLFQYGAFGDEKLDLKKEGKIYSYDSGDLTNQPGDDDFESTGEGDVGSNGKVKLKKDTFIDGDVGLGDDGGDPLNEATYDDHEDAIVMGDIEDVPRVDPDPLGAAIGGDLDADFEYYSASDKNDNADAGITGNAISLENGESLTLTAGNYYLTSIVLKNGSILNINGPVNIYLDGEGYGDVDDEGEEVKFHAHNGSSINITGNPPDFTIFSNSTKKIDLKHGTTFKGTIYAPYSKVKVSHSANVYGMIWANKVDIKNSGELYFDTALKDKWLADTVSIVSWREVLN